MLDKIRKTKRAMGVAKDFQKVLCSSCKRRVMKELKKGNMQGAMDKSNLCEDCANKLQAKAEEQGKDNLEGMVDNGKHR